MAAGENQIVLLDGSFLNERDADEEYVSLEGSYINDEAAGGGGGGGFQTAWAASSNTLISNGVVM
jgi:hypothetical protein